jgi:hypothetical protein
MRCKIQESFSTLLQTLINDKCAVTVLLETLMIACSCHPACHTCSALLSGCLTILSSSKPCSCTMAWAEEEYAEAARANRERKPMVPLQAHPMQECHNHKPQCLLPDPAPLLAPPCSVTPMSPAEEPLRVAPPLCLRLREPRFIGRCTGTWQ